MKKHRLLGLVLLVLILALLAYKLTQKGLPRVQNSKTLVVITSNGPNTYYVKNEGEYAGFEYDLVNLFAKDLGPDYSVKIITADHLGDVIPKLLEGKAHLAAANLSITPDRASIVKFGPSYLDVQQHIDTHRHTHKHSHTHTHTHTQTLTTHTHTHHPHTPPTPEHPRAPTRRCSGRATRPTCSSPRRALTPRNPHQPPPTPSASHQPRRHHRD